MEKLKLLVILLLVAVLFQVACLSNSSDVETILNMILPIIVYLIVIKDVNKDTILKK